MSQVFNFGDHVNGTLRRGGEEGEGEGGRIGCELRPLYCKQQRPTIFIHFQLAGDEMRGQEHIIASKNIKLGGGVRFEAI